MDGLWDESNRVSPRARVLSGWHARAAPPLDATASAGYVREGTHPEADADGMAQRGNDILDQFLRALPEDTRAAFLEEVFRSLGTSQQRELLEALQRQTEAGTTAQANEPPGGTPTASTADQAPGRPSEPEEGTPDEAVVEAWSASLDMPEADRQDAKATMRRQLWGCIGLLVAGGAVLMLLSWLLRYGFDRLMEGL